MALLYSEALSGLNLSHWYSSSDPLGIPLGEEEQFRPFMNYVWNLGVRNVRLGGSWYPTAQQSALTVSRMMHAKGFMNIFGWSFPKGNDVYPYSGITPAKWKIYESLYLFPDITICAAGDVCDVFSIANEPEGNIITEPVASLSRVSNVVTATFAGDHYYKIGDTVIIAGATPSDYNNATGATIIDVPTPNTFTYSATGVDGSATGTITAKMTVATFIRLAKDTAIAARVIAPNLKYIISSTGTYVSQWVAAGITPGVDFDYWGLQTYGGSATDLSGFRSIIKTAVDGLGDNVWLTEWNIYFTWPTALSQVTLERMYRETRSRMEIIKQLGVSHAFFYTTVVGTTDDFAILNHQWPWRNNFGPRNGFNALFSDGNLQLINEKSGTGIANYRNVNTPYMALRTFKGGVDRGKCIDFNQSNSYLTGSYPAPFTAANMVDFTVAVRLYPRSLGGSSAGRIISGVNQKFLEFYTASGGYIVELWFTSTVARINSGGPINFNTWQTVFITYQGSLTTENYPRIYIDGKEKTVLLTNKGGVRGDSTPQTLSIGNRSDLIRGYDGKMDDLFFWNRVLTQEEMNSFRNGNMPGQYVCGFTMDEPSGNIIDKIPGGAVLTLSNADQNVTSYVA